MTVRRGLPIPALLALGLSTFSLAACDGASPAGDDLIGQGGAPVVSTLPVTDVASAPADDLSAGFALGNAPTQIRLLAGAVADPSFGEVTATAYVDFARAALPADVAGRTPSSVDLILPVNAYAYGDTTANVTLGIARVSAGVSWTPLSDSLEAGQLIPTDAPFSSVTIVPEDSTYTIALAPSWVAGNDSLLTGADYAARFEGLALIPAPGSGAVRGLTATGIRLRVVVADDTLTYFANEVYSRIETTPPAGTAVRDGSGRALGLTLPLAADSLRDNALSQARLVLRLDTAALQADGLFRPLPSVLSLVGVREDSSRIAIANGSVRDGAVSFSGSALTALVQDAILGDPLFERYEAVFPSSPATINVVPFSSSELVLVRVPPVD